MNRHERRKTVKLGRTVEQLTGAAATAAVKNIRGSMCKWNDCGETFAAGPLLDGWRWLIVHHNATPCDLALIDPDKWDHDAVLCPTHATALDQSLKNLSMPAAAPAAGSA